MSDAALSWMAVHLLAGVPRRQRMRIQRAQTEHGDLLMLSGEAVASRAQVPLETARRLSSAAHRRLAAEELDRARRDGVTVVTFADPVYPEPLRTIDDPPPCLYVRGAGLDGGPGIAVVGARRASVYGRGVARRLGEELARRGATVVSGLAYGVDAEAHRGALDADGRTVAVLGCGVDRVYPSAHARLARRLRDRGALVSELPLGSAPRRHHFPRRNRLISGLALVVVVVEAGERSGSLITARLALEQGREVLAVPGDVTARRSRGTNLLLRDGARPVLDADDVVAALPFEHRAGRLAPSAAAAAPADPDARSVLAALDAGDGQPLGVDALVAICGLAPARVATVLTGLELERHVLRTAAGYVRR